jgi:hypothetical protein
MKFDVPKLFMLKFDACFYQLVYEIRDDLYITTSANDRRYTIELVKIRDQGIVCIDKEYW